MNKNKRAFLTLAFASVALVLAACQGGGFDSGTGGMPGEGGVGPPVGNPGPIGASPGEMQGPEIGPNGQPELTAPGATLAPNEAQYPVGQGSSGMKCPQVLLQMQQYNCVLSFNLPPPSASPSPDASGKSSKAKATPTPTPTPTPSPSPSPSSSSDDEDSSDVTPTPSPPGTITLQVEALPKDVPPMANRDMRALSVAPLMAIRLQSDSNFTLNGYGSVQYVIPRQQLPDRGFAIQLYNEGVLRGKRTDQFLATYNKYVQNDQILVFNFPTPKITVKRGQIWLLALYGLTYPPNATPTASPTPEGSSSPSNSTFTPGPSPSPT